jgi:beta-glucanase (GH16 family)
VPVLSSGRHRARPDPALWWLVAVVLVVVLVGGCRAARIGTPRTAAPVEPARPTAHSGVPADWGQVFADDFDGTALDRSVWQPDRSGEKAGVPFNTDIEDGWFSPDNVSVADGSLVFTIGDDDRTIHGLTYGYSSGMVQSNAAIPLTPSRYVEARIRFPRCDGCWPAFWLHPLDRWPPEIDIAEYLETGVKSRPGFNYFDADGKKTGLKEYGARGVDYRDEWHTYGVLWEGDRIVPYLDGKPYPELAATENITQGPMMIILNLSVRAGFDTVPGQKMLVDWVRVWSPPAPSSAAPSS